MTRKVDFSNAFVQSPMKRTVCVSLPAMFNEYNGHNPKDLCLLLVKSLYGLREAPKLWHDWLEKGLIKSGFKVSSFDPGIYYGRGMALVVYVDDVLFFGPSELEMAKVIEELKADGFELKLEKTGEQSTYDFLGINIVQTAEGVLKCTQLGLIKKLLECVDMSDCNPAVTPCEGQPLGTNPNGEPHSAEWEYASAVGMLMYLAGNSYPEIQFSVHQCARFTHCPKTTHSKAIKRIARYLKGVLNEKEGLRYNISNSVNLDMYCDADFAGLWKYEDDQDPVCVRSRTGYVMTLGGCPIHWSSKLQTEQALSTLEAEYIALAQGMKEFVHMRRFYDEMMHEFKLKDTTDSIIMSKIFEDNTGCISTVQAPKMSSRTKHIAVKYHFCRQFFNKNPSVEKNHPFLIEHIDSMNQKADIFTKGLSEATFLWL